MHETLFIPSGLTLTVVPQFFDGITLDTYCAHTVGQHLTTLCQEQGFTWDENLDAATVDLNAALINGTNMHLLERQYQHQIDGLGEYKLDPATPLEICWGADGARFQFKSKLTPLVFKLPLLAPKPGEPRASHLVGLYAGNDSATAALDCLGPLIQQINGLTGDFVFDGQHYALQQRACMDLMTMASFIRIGKAGSTCACPACTCPTKEFKDYRKKKWQERTLAKQRGFSHAVVGAFCNVCDIKVTQSMVDLAATYDDKMTTQHRLSHHGTPFRILNFAMFASRLRDFASLTRPDLTIFTPMICPFLRQARTLACCRCLPTSKSRTTSSACYTCT